MAKPEEAEQFSQSVRDAALAAMEESGLSEDNWPVDEADPASEEEETDPVEVSEEAVQEDPDPEEAEASEEAATSEEDDSVPTEWFGVDLSGLPSEQRAEIIAHYKEQDKYAQSLAQKLAAKGEEEPEEKPEPQAEPEPLDDDQLMKALGIDEDDPMYEVKKEIMAPLGRIIAQQQEVLAEVQAEREEQAFISWWESGLNEMEEQFGPLSIDRDDLAKIALKEGLRSPQEAYARVALSGRKTVEELVAKAKEGVKEKAKAKPPSTQRPKSEAAVKKEPAKLLSPTEAAEAAAKATGFDWGEALKQVV